MRLPLLAQTKMPFYAWMTRVLQKAKKVKVPTRYKSGRVHIDFMQNVVKLSVQENGPVLVQVLIKKNRKYIHNLTSFSQNSS